MATFSNNLVQELRTIFVNLNLASGTKDWDVVDRAEGRLAELIFKLDVDTNKQT